MLHEMSRSKKREEILPGPEPLGSVLNDRQEAQGAEEIFHLTDGRRDRRQPPAEQANEEPRLTEMDTAEFVEHLRSREVEVRAKDSKLLLTAPVGSVSIEIQSELRRRKPEIIAFLLNSLDAAEREYLAPLTYAQQRLWLVDKSAPYSSAYNIPQALILPGEIEYQPLRNAISRLAERHEALRTRIEVRNGEPAQVISRHLEIPVALTDLTGLDAETQQARLQALLVEQSGLPFALDRAPLIRFHAVRLGSDRQLIFYNIHHIVADQWSLGLLRRDLSALYTEAVSGTPADLPPVRLRYSDIATSERSSATTELHSSQLQYWRERLQDMPALLELPFTKSRPPQQSFSGATFSFPLEADITRRLRELAVGMNTSMYLLLLTVFATLLYRYTGQKDLCVGTPVTGRKRREGGGCCWPLPEHAALALHFRADRALRSLAASDEQRNCADRLRVWRHSFSAIAHRIAPQTIGRSLFTVFSDHIRVEPWWSRHRRRTTRRVCKHV